jgi:hypothetical protein
VRCCCFFAPSTLGSSLSEIQIQPRCFSPLSRFRLSSFLRVGSTILNKFSQIEVCECSVGVICVATTGSSLLPPITLFGMFGASRFVRGHSGGMPSLSLAAERFIRADTAIPPTFPKRSATPFQAIEIDSDEERESSLLDFDFNNFTSKPAAMTTAAMKPAAMTAIDRDTKVAKTNDHTRLNLKRKLNEYMSLRLPAINTN